MNSSIKLEKSEFLAVITLSKPPLNIFEVEDLVCLEGIFEALNKEKTLKLIVIKSDQKIFSAGVSVSCHSKENVAEALGAFHRVFHKMISLDIPTLSLVKGACYGGGTEFAMFCDFVLASKDAVFSQPEINIGCFPPVSIVAFPVFAGNKKVLEMILTGNAFKAQEMVDMGLVNHVFSEDEFDTKADEFIAGMMSKSSSVIRETLKTFKQINYADLKEKLDIAEKIYIDELMKLEDSQEGISGFLQKRKPLWTNR